MRTLMTFILFLALIVPLQGGAQDRAAGEASKVALELLQLTGAGQLGVQMMNQMIQSQKKILPEIPEKFWTELRNEVQPDDLNEKLVPIYTKHLSSDDLKGITTFYKTSVGQKFISKQPLILQESIVIGQAWGRQLGEKISAKLKKEGYAK